MRNRLTLCAATLALAAGLPAAADIYRCAAKGGTVSYQELPCPDHAVGERANVPTEFPPVNTEARDRLFAKEEAMYRRLEAQRDRDMQESVLRDAAAERALERARLEAYTAAQQSQYVYALPYRVRQSGMRPPVTRPRLIQ